MVFKECLDIMTLLAVIIVFSKNIPMNIRSYTNARDHNLFWKVCLWNLLWTRTLTLKNYLFFTTCFYSLINYDSRHNSCCLGYSYSLCRLYNNHYSGLCISNYVLPDIQCQQNVCERNTHWNKSFHYFHRLDFDLDKVVEHKLPVSQPA